MNQLEAAVLEVAQFLDSRGSRYMVVGGFAALHWGRQRLTRDLDLTVDVPTRALVNFIGDLRGQFQLVDHDALQFAGRNHLIRLRTRAAVPVDLMLAVLPYQHAALDRAVDVALGPRSIRMCSAEDLIIYKLASERLQDRIDVEGVVLRQADALDRRYLEPRVRDLAAGLERPEILDIYTAALEKAGLDPPATGREQE